MYIRWETKSKLRMKINIINATQKARTRAIYVHNWDIDEHKTERLEVQRWNEAEADVGCRGSGARLRSTPALAMLG